MKYFLFVIAIFISNISFGQNLKDIFLGLPYTITGLEKHGRDSMVYNYIHKNHGGVGVHKYYLTVYEPTNGYLGYTGAYEGSTTITYWNMSNGNKLIGMVSESCGGACDSDIAFWLLSNGVYKKLDVDKVLPTVSFGSFMDVEKMKKDGIDIDMAMSSMSFYDPFYYLPFKGKNIVIEAQIMDFSEKFKKYNLGQKIEMIWDDGKFIKGENIK